MDTVNAVSKVRFASARPQRVHLAGNESQLVELLCLEPGQETKTTTGPCVYYVVACLGPQEPHTLTSTGEDRLICLALGCPR